MENRSWSGKESGVKIEKGGGGAGDVLGGAGDEGDGSIIQQRLDLCQVNQGVCRQVCSCL